jgi:hypothetical protein
MSSQIRYQFHHARDVLVVRFEGATLPLELLKKEIASQNSLHSASDLVITDTSGAVFGPGSQVHKNTSVLVKSKAPVGPAIVMGAADSGGIPGLGGGGPKRCVVFARVLVARLCWSGGVAGWRGAAGLWRHGWEGGLGA